MCATHEADERASTRTTNGQQSGALAESSPPRAADRAPETLVPREEGALGRVRVLTRLLDEAIRVPGTDFRVGIDPLLGVLPVGGDAVAAALALYPIFEAYRFGAPRRTIARMVLLVAVDAAVGSIPVLGTVFDAFWKANEWNRRSFERHLRGD